MKSVEPIRDIKIIKNMRAILKSQSTRNELLFILGINIGLRISDILKLKVNDIIRSNGKTPRDYVIITEMKTNKTKKFYIDNDEIDLTHLEHDLLLEFVKNKDILMSREHLLNSVWKDSFDKKVKTVNVAIKRLKAKIDPDGTKEYIKSVRGEGYIFC